MQSPDAYPYRILPERVIAFRMVILQVLLYASILIAGWLF